MPISQRVQHFSIYRRIHPMPRFSELLIAPFALPQCPAQFVQNLRTVCPQANTNRSAGAFLDSSANQFDNAYYKHLVEGKGVFSSDQALFLENPTKTIVKRFARDENAFFKAFETSMVKLASVGVITSGGEVRLNCRKVNS